jgi:hypothetical protein
MLTFLRAPRSSLPGFSRQSIEEIHFAKIDGYPYQVRARRTWRLCELNVRHDRFARDHFRREPYPVMRGRVRTWTWPRRGPARSRVPANRHRVQRKEARTAARLRRSGDEAWEDVAPRYAAAVRFEIRNEKARSGFFRAGFMIFAMMKICR